MDLPIVCTLTEAELRERRRTVLDSIRENATEVTPTAEGYIYRFKGSPDVLSQLCKLVELESQCCQFLTFKLIVAPQQRLILEVSGPPGAKAAIADILGE